MVKIGHALFKDSSINIENLQETAGAILQLHRAGHRVIVVAGGGELSRRLIDAARQLRADLATCDEVGIRVTRLNALLLAIALGEDASRNVIGSFEDLERQLNASVGSILVAGGFMPAQSTDAVAALIAERVSADLLIKTTDVDGIYDSDPKKNPKAKMFKKVSIAVLKDILGQEQIPGEYKLLDSVAISILERSRIPAVIVNGSFPQNILRAALGEDAGTRIEYQ
ncbi:MAG: UMP kinase [Thermoproteota archaeon]